MTDLEEYKEEVLKRRKHKKSKISNSFGVYDVYKHIRKNGWYNIGGPVKEKTFYAIIRGINNILAEKLAEGETVEFPCFMGKLELRKFKAGASIVNGKLRNTYPIDWQKTLNLWYEDEEARNMKILLRMEEPWIYHIKYCIGRARFENKIFYQFVLNRNIKRGLSINIKKGKIDTLW